MCPDCCPKNNVTEGYMNLLFLICGHCVGSNKGRTVWRPILTMEKGKENASTPEGAGCSDGSRFTEVSDEDEAVPKKWL